MSRIALALTLLSSATALSACLSEAPLEANTGAPEHQTLLRFPTYLDLPTCTSTVRGTVYFVESTGRFYYCDGSRHVSIDVTGDPDSPVMTLSEEPPGANCPAGGDAVRIGLDLDGDGRLDDNEITDVVYDCAPERVHVGDVVITSEDDLDILNGVEVLDGDLHISGISTLQTDADLRLLTVEGDLTITDTTLQNLFGLQTLQRIGGHLTLSGNDQLDSLLGLDHLFSVGGDLAIEGITTWNLVGLESLLHVGGAVSIVDSTHINNLNGLHNLQTVGSTLTIEANTNLVSIDELSSLHSVEGYLSVVDNDRLAAVRGLNALQNANGVGLGRNPALKIISGFQALEEVNCNPTTKAPGISIYTNQTLEELSGFTSLKCAADVSIRNNAGLRSIRGLSELESVQSLEIYQNDSLPTLEGLEGLRLAAHHLEIIENIQLTSISALSNLEPETTGEIRDNWALPECRIDELIETYGYTGLRVSNNGSEALVIPPAKCKSVYDIA